MPMELLSAEGYAAQAGVSPESYVIQVLRAERERRQALDEITRSQLMMDEQIDGAIAAGMGVLQYTACKLADVPPDRRLLAPLGDVRPGDLSKYYMMQLIGRLQERLLAAETLTEGESA
jgi:hypothetical protein